MLSADLEQFHIYFERSEPHAVDYERALLPRLESGTSRASNRSDEAGHVSGARCHAERMAAEWIAHDETGYLFRPIYNLRGRFAIAIATSWLVGLADEPHR